MKNRLKFKNQNLKIRFAIIFIIVVVPVLPSGRQFIEPFSKDVFAEDKSIVEKSKEEQMETFKSEDPEIRAKAIDDIVKTDDKTIKYLIDALKDENKTVRKKAIIKLGEIGDSSALNILMKMSMQYEDHELQQLASTSVNKITNRVYYGGPEFNLSSEKKETINNKFFRISGGYLKESLGGINSFFTDAITSNQYYSSPDKKFPVDGILAKIDFGYRFGNSCGVGGFGYIYNRSINTQWSVNGTKGEISLYSYFIEFAYRHYLAGEFEKENPARKLFPYLSGGLGFYFSTIKFNDINIAFANYDQDPVTYSYNPEASGSQIGFNLSAGLEFFLFKALSIDVNGGYLFAKISKLNYYSIELKSERVLIDLSGKALDIDLSGPFGFIGINLYVL